MARKRKESSESTNEGSPRGSKDYPVHRNAANARERARMRVLSKAFSRLKTSLPWVPADTKLSKLDTLRLASSYIAHLRDILTEDSPNTINPITLTWPFTFNRVLSQDYQALHHENGQEGNNRGFAPVQHYCRERFQSRHNEVVTYDNSDWHQQYDDGNYL